jgi:hypothetical protein
MALTARTPAAPAPVHGERARSQKASATATLLLLLGAGDALFVLLHLAHVTTPVFQDPRFSLELERGFAEVYQYLKEYWAALLLLLIGVRRRTPVFVAWAVLFGYLLADDAFAVHERLGREIATGLALGDGWPVQGHDVGEVLVAGAVGALALAAIGLTHARSEPAARQASGRLLRWLALLAFFGVGVDALHQMFDPGVWHTVLGVVEDGGEMAVMTAIVWLAAGLHRDYVP